MRTNRLVVHLVAAGVASVLSAPAPANLIFNNAITQQGTGLGAVPTLVTIQDAGAQGNGTESGCTSATLGSPPGSSFTCLNGLEGGDNQAINQLRRASDLPGLTSAGQLALVVNLNEPGNDNQATLTNLYLSVYSASTGALLGNHQYAGAPLELEQVNGIGGAGSVFTLTPGEQTLINGECPVLSQCLFGGGLQFASGSTAGGPETLFLSFVEGRPLPPSAIPEPSSLALIGLSLAALAALRRKIS